MSNDASLWSFEPMWMLPSVQQKISTERLPDGTRIYVVGDVHGRADLLDQLLRHIDLDLARRPIHQAIQVFLGDYIDRGPASREVLDRLIERNRTHEMVFLRGNHETFLLEFLENPAVLGEWRRFGGLETLLSYGLKPVFNSTPVEQIELAHTFAEVLPESHLQFLKALKPWFSCGDFFFVHAGVNPRVPLTEQLEEDLLWIRDDFLTADTNFGKLVVHGHTPMAEPDIRSNRINIDTGAFATGRLTCLIIEGSEMMFFNGA
jgi:serine/threonine protein phosphatase 1